MTHRFRLLPICRMTALTLLALCLTPLLLAQGGDSKSTSKTGSGKSGNNTGGSNNQAPSDAVHDVITNAFTSADACTLASDTKQFEQIRKIAAAVSMNQDFTSWSTNAPTVCTQDTAKLTTDEATKQFVKCASTGYPLAKAIAAQCPDCAKAAPDTAYIFHIVTWDHPSGSGTSVTVPVSSAWHVYQQKGTDTIKSSGFHSSGEPRIYNKKQIAMIGVDLFGPGKTGTVAEAYSTSATQGSPENQADLVALFGALLGVSASPNAVNLAPTGPPCNEIFVAAGMQQGTTHLPFDVKVTVASDSPNDSADTGAEAPPQSVANPPVAGTNANNPQLGASADNSPGKQKAASQKQPSTPPAPGVMTCTGKSNGLPCATTRTFTSVDLEWWDVSIGITTPGVRESQYSIVNGALQQSTTLHTNLYGMIDLYPFAKIAAKDDWAPHVNLGVPVTSQSLYRPYFGLVESVGGFLTLFRPRKQISLPLNINVFGGMVFMKTQIVVGNPTTADELAADRRSTHVWKPLFGIEVPISSIASKIKGAASKNSNSSGKSSSSGGGS